jgi:histidinol-phosphate aminotransferase
MKVSKDIATLVPYKAGKPISETQREYGISRVVKLASNENPLGVSPLVMAAIKKATQNIHRYPDPACFELIEVAAKKWKVAKPCISVGNGSNEIIDLLIRIFCEPGDEILTTDKAFIAYQICAQAARVKCRFAPLTENYGVDINQLGEILENDRDGRIKLIFLANPNNPTGSYIASEAMLSFLKKYGNDENRLIIFDEAYTEYVRAPDYQSAVSLMPQFRSLVIMRTLSKVYGLAGLRVGLLFASAETVDYFNRVRNPFNINEFAQVAAIAALQDDEFVSKSVRVNSEGLDFFYNELKKLKLPFVESQGNFVMFDSQRDASKVHEGLLRQGVILRPLLNYGLPRHFRMSVGLREENRLAISALQEVFKNVRN